MSLLAPALSAAITLQPHTVVPHWPLVPSFSFYRWNYNSIWFYIVFNDFLLVDEPNHFIFQLLDFFKLVLNFDFNFTTANYKKFYPSDFIFVIFLIASRSVILLSLAWFAYIWNCLFLRHPMDWLQIFISLILLSKNRHCWIVFFFFFGTPCVCSVLRSHCRLELPDRIVTQAGSRMFLAIFLIISPKCAISCVSPEYGDFWPPRYTVATVIKVGVYANIKTLSAPTSIFVLLWFLSTPQYLLVRLCLLCL